MSFRLVIFLVIACLGLDYLVRLSLRRRHDRHALREREDALKAPARLEFAETAVSLTRVEVPGPKARILAVDDEKVVLDSFRRILVLDGYSVDTVETGPEALSLLRRNDYDFVFTDLKMPDMDGVEVVKAVAQLRPDVDLIVITGYGTIETAVETMAYGACEYLRKPFSTEELAGYVDSQLQRRRARLQAARRPLLRPELPSGDQALPSHEYPSAHGSFIAEAHLWAWIEPGGHVRVGLDDFAAGLLDGITEVVLPMPERQVRRGEPLFTLRRGADELTFAAPLDGQVLDINGTLAGDPSRVSRSPYRDGWICRLDPADLTTGLSQLVIGRGAAEWYEEEGHRLQAVRRVQADPAAALPWDTLAKEIFTREKAPMGSR